MRRFLRLAVLSLTLTGSLAAQQASRHPDFAGHWKQVSGDSIEGLWLGGIGEDLVIVQDAKMFKISPFRQARAADQFTVPLDGSKVNGLVTSTSGVAIPMPML